MIHPTFETVKAGTLAEGDQFEFQPSSVDGASWKVFTFRGHVVTDKGFESINCYGGDPDPKADRAWRAFDVDRVRAEARPVRAKWRTKRAPVQN